MNDAVTVIAKELAYRIDGINPNDDAHYGWEDDADGVIAALWVAGIRELPEPSDSEVAEVCVRQAVIGGTT